MERHVGGDQKTYYTGISAYTGAGTCQVLKCFENFKLEYEINFQLEFEKKILTNLRYINQLISGIEVKNQENFNFFNSKKSSKNFTETDNDAYFDVLEYMVLLKAEGELILTNKFAFSSI